jgi:hypothetical protein
MSPNPYQAPQGNSTPPRSRAKIRTIIGLAILLAGLGVAVYGAVAFWVLQGLPPNNSSSGRLPSLYMLFGGMGLLLLGLTIRNLRLR